MHVLVTKTCVSGATLLSRVRYSSLIPNCLHRTARPTAMTSYASSEFKRNVHNQAGPLPPFDHRKRFKLTAPPLPEWKFGDGVNLHPGEERASWKGTDEARRTKVWDMSNTSPKEIYQLLTSVIIPRPIAFVSSLSNEGVPNLAPFSYFSMISHNPPMISISFLLSQRRPKDTRENILQTKEFTVNIISEPFVHAANATSVESPADTNEWLLAGLTPAKSVLVKPPIVKESAVSMECEMYSYQDISASSQAAPTTTVVLGLIKKMHVGEPFLEEDGLTVDAGKLRPVARLGGKKYARVVEGFELPRMSWKEVKGAYEAILK